MKNKLNILYVCPYLPMRNYHAGSTRMFEIIKDLSFRHSVSVISFVSPKEVSGIEELKNICEHLITVPRKSSSDRFSLAPGYMRSFDDRNFRNEIETLLKKRRFDLIHFEYCAMAQYASLCNGTTTLLTCHELKLMSNYRALRYEKNLIRKTRLLLRLIHNFYFEISDFNRIKGVVFLTDKERAIASKNAHRCITEIIPMGVDTSFFIKTNNQRQEYDFLFVGNFNHKPNVDTVEYFYRTIFPLVKEKKPHAKFAAVGIDADYKLKHLQGEDGVFLFGCIDDIRPFYNKSKIFVNPIRSGAGMRGKLLEAAAMEKAIVSTSIGAEGFDNEAGAITICDKPQDFVRSLMFLLDNEPARIEMGQSARKKVESRYSWRIAAQKVEEFYHRVLN